MLSSKRSHSLLVSSLAMALVLIVSGCQKYGQQEARVAGDGKADPKNDPSGKPTDTYTPEEKTHFVDIAKLKAFEGQLAPVFKKMAGPSWAASIQMKKWLFVPQELNGDDTRNMSVRFLDNEDKALAIQTSRDIRVQKALFEALSEVDQADFLLQEILTSVYLFKTLNDTELCTMVKSYNNKLACPFLKMGAVEAQEVVQADEELDHDNRDNNNEIQEAAKRKQAVPTAAKKPKPINDPRFGKKEPLKAPDYHRIELLMTYLKEEKDVTQKKIIGKMTELGFDTRIFQIQIPTSLLESQAAPVAVSEKN